MTKSQAGGSMFTSAVDDSHSGDGDLEGHGVPCIVFFADP